ERIPRHRTPLRERNRERSPGAHRRVGRHNVAARGDPVRTATQPAESAAAPAKCLEAAVNPVTRSAYCVNRRGAPVDPPPRESLNRLCKPRAPDDDAFTAYEHWSGC